MALRGLTIGSVVTYPNCVPPPLVLQHCVLLHACPFQNTLGILGNNIVLLSFIGAKTTTKRHQKEQLIMKYLKGLSDDTKPLSCSSANRGKMLLKGHLSIKSYTQYNTANRLLQGNSIQS